MQTIPLLATDDQPKQQVTITTPSISQLKFTIERHYEEIDSRNAGLDSKEVAWIESEINAGNSWAWCCVEIKGFYKGLESSQYLGGCSYKSQDDFLQSGYAADMQTEAHQDILNQILSLSAEG